MQTPNGRRFPMISRADTADEAVATGVMAVDEYHLQGHHWSGWAIDVGAYTGVVTLALALDNPDLRIVSVEVVPENVELITQNVRLNGLTDRVFVESAAATRPGVKSVKVPYHYRSVGIAGGTNVIVPSGYVHGLRYMASLFEYPKGEMDADELKAPGLSLDTILDRYQIERVALLKIDCEGCEWQFLHSPALTRVDEIRGEYHDAGTYEEFLALLDPTHIVTQWTTGNVGTFGAVLRQ